MQKTTWEIHGFDIADSPYKVKATAAASEEAEEESKPAKAAAPKEFVIKLPAGMENWFSTDFDAKKAGWKNAPATFGVKMDENVPEELAWIAKYPLYPLKRTMPTTFIENDVVLMRKTLEVPAPKEGHRYRIRVNGSIHENSGEAFAIYINGKELYKINQGVTAFRKQGLRGSHIWKENLEDLKGGKITIAVANYPMNNWDAKSYIPAIGPLSVWLEEQKLPPIKL
jgi:hypothetical protein